MSSTYRSILGLAIFAAAIVLPGLSPAHADDPDPAAILKDAAAALAEHQSFRLDATILYKGKFQGSEEELPTTFTIAFERPDRVSVHVDNPQNEIFLYGDGKEYTRYSPHYKQFVVDPQTNSTEEIIGMGGFELIDPALRVIAALTGADPFSGPLAPQSPKFIGQEDVNGQKCDRIHFATADRSYDVWIGAAPARLVRRIEPEMTPEEKKLSAEYNTPFDLTVTATLDKWELGADVAGLVKFSAPEGAEKVAAFMPPRQVSPAEKMAGSPAPDFTLPQLGGGTVTLSALKGKVVVLDFWATWCGPCRVGMPAMQQISGEYAEKGVRVFAVNQAEEEVHVKAFIDANGLNKLNVLLDVDGAVNASYNAEGIPQSVIIGPDGVIHAVHVGIPTNPAATAAATTREEAEKIVSDGYAAFLRAELDELLSGKKPVE